MIKFPIKLFYFSILPSSILYLAILYISNIHNIKLSLVIRDLAQTCGYPIGVGMISNIGILLWGAASSICFFTTFSESINRELSKLLLLGGLFSGLLCIDDFFLLHDRYVGPDFLNLTYLAILTLTNTTNSSLFGLSNINFQNLMGSTKLFLIIFMIIGKIELISIFILFKKVLFKE